MKVARQASFYSMTETIDIQHYWIEELKRGSEQAAYNLYNSYSKAMYNTLVRIVGDSDDANDILQEAFIKAFDKIDTYRGDATFGSWLKRIVVNKGLEFLRKRKVQFEELDDEHLELEEEIYEDDIITTQQIHESIKKLPDGCRTVFSLYLIEGYSHQDIADELGISLSTSKTQYRRAKSLLHDSLKDKIYG